MHNTTRIGGRQAILKLLYH